MTSARLMVIDVDDTLQTAARSLSKPGVGLVVVRNGNGEAAGVLSKPDLVRHLTNPTPFAPSVSVLMSSPIMSGGPQDDLHAV